VKNTTYTIALLAFMCATGVSAQEVTVTAEPLAVGVQLATKGSPWRLGASMTAGPLVGVAFNDTDVSDAKNAATAFAAIIYRPAKLQVVFNPIGAALIVGNDFSSVYPAAQLGADVVLGRWTLGTAVRTIRIAGPNGGADYWTHWIPVRVGLVLGSP
jgi:hypothetical protein